MSNSDLDSVIENFRTGAFSTSTGEGLLPRQWGDADWRNLFRFTTWRSMAAGTPLIQRGEHSRTLYFVLRGRLEVAAHSSDGVSLGSINEAGPGSVLGELSFFDGDSRSASVWATTDCEVAAMTPDQYGEFEGSHPDLARGLLFALGCTLASRLRRATAKVSP